MPQQLQRVTGHNASAHLRVTMLPEADSQTFYVGDIVAMDASTGKVLAIANDTTITSSTTNKLLGIALANSKNAVNPGNTPVHVFDDELIFYVAISNSHTQGSATGSDRSASEYQDVKVGDQCQLRKNGNAPAVLTTTIGTNPVVQIVAKLPGIAATEPFERVLVKVLPAQRAIQ